MTLNEDENMVLRCSQICEMAVKMIWNLLLDCILFNSYNRLWHRCIKNKLYRIAIEKFCYGIIFLLLFYALIN